MTPDCGLAMRSWPSTRSNRYVRMGSFVLRV